MFLLTHLETSCVIKKISPLQHRNSVLTFLSSISFLHWMPSVFTSTPSNCRAPLSNVFAYANQPSFPTDRPAPDTRSDMCFVIGPFLVFFTYQCLTSSLTLTSLLAVLFTPMLRDTCTANAVFLTLQLVDPFAHPAYTHTTHTYTLLFGVYYDPNSRCWWHRSSSTWAVGICSTC